MQIRQILRIRDCVGSLWETEQKIGKGDRNLMVIYTDKITHRKNRHLECRSAENKSEVFLGTALVTAG